MNAKLRARQVTVLRTLVVLSALLSSAASTCALAVGTPSGTTVSNVASIQYVQAGASLQVTSNASSFRVDEILNVTVQKSDQFQF